MDSRDTPAPLDRLVGDTPAMHALRALVAAVAPHATTALVTGETGSGKELVARAVHALGPRRTHPLVAVNCSAIMESLFESELFGHVRGAFTGATEGRPGLFERAHGGTLLLDEIGELPIAAQAKLLRVIETGEVCRVGSHETRRVDACILAATNRVLEDEVRAGRFRADLLYRLNAIELRVPPLRERRGDIPLLAAWFLEDAAGRYGRTPLAIDSDALAALQAHAWPGNVRELRNVIDRAAMLCRHDVVTVDVLWPAPGAFTSAPCDAAPPGVRRIDELERDAIARALAVTSGNKRQAAVRLGISRRALYRRIEKFGLAA